MNDFQLTSEHQAEVCEAMLGHWRAEAEKSWCSTQKLNAADWRGAAQATLLARRSRVLQALSDEALEAIVGGLVDPAAIACSLESRADDVAEMVASSVLEVGTLKSGNRDAADFKDLAVWKLRQALRAAYQAGRSDCTGR